METREREQRRLAALYAYQVLDRPPQAELESVVRVAAAVAQVPAAALNLMDANRQSQLTAVGFAGRDCDRADAMCAVRLDEGRFVHLPDARLEPDYQHNPYVTGERGTIVFYASAPLISPGGYVLGTLCVYDDVPRRLSAEQIGRLEDLATIVVAFFERRRQARLTAELAAETESRKQWIESLVETVDVAVIAVDTVGGVTTFNRAARDRHDPDLDVNAPPLDLSVRLTLYEPDGVTPMPEEDIPLVTVLRGGGPVTGRELMVRPPGREPVRLRANAKALTGPDGAVTGGVVALHDITTAHARRQVIEDARERLAAANAELSRSNADLTNFAGAVSHDLVAPLAAVGGYLDLLADEVHGPPRERVEAAARVVTRMHELITALLGYARAGSAPVRRVRVPLGNLLDHVLLDMRTEIDAVGARVSVVGQLPELSCDPVLVRQLLQNLIGNAVKYRRPDRPCEITVSATGDVVRIADNGVGIPAEQREQVFEMFTRGGGGPGVGLSSCLRIVDRHGGTMRLEDSPAGGVEVVFSLPGPGGSDAG